MIKYVSLNEIQNRLRDMNRNKTKIEGDWLNRWINHST